VYWLFCYLYVKFGLCNAGDRVNVRVLEVHEPENSSFFFRKFLPKKKFTYVKKIYITTIIQIIQERKAGVTVVLNSK
jgi:hypothetical protein